MRIRSIAAKTTLTVLLAGSVSTSQAMPVELFFSEYVEGSSNNKALEIYNGTGAAVDLSAGGYSVQMFFNGNPSAGLTINLSGTVASGDVFVLAQSSASASILAQADQTSGAGFFNGDDAIALRKGTTTVDVIGQIGVDPGSQWGAGLTSTQDNTLRRKSSVLAGDPTGSDAFNPSVEWEGFATDTFDGLGSHSTQALPLINEFSASTAGTDVEYIEIWGQPNTDYSAFTILEIEGDGSGAGVIDEVIPVGTTDSSSLWTISLPANSLENGTITLILVRDFTGSLGTDLDTNDDGVFDAVLWGLIADGVAVFDGGGLDRTYAVPVLGPNYDGVSSFPPGGASRIPDGADTDTAADWVRNDFDLAGIPGFVGTLVQGETLNTPGALNAAGNGVPEPATLALLCVALAGLGFSRRRKRR